MTQSRSDSPTTVADHDAAAGRALLAAAIEIRNLLDTGALVRDTTFDGGDDWHRRAVAFAMVLQRFVLAIEQAPDAWRPTGPAVNAEAE